MNLTVGVLIRLAMSAVLALANKGSDSVELTIRTSTGSFTGLIEPKYPKTRQWRAIPFAEPPVASDRKSVV